MSVYILVAIAGAVGLVLETTIFNLVPFDALRPDVSLILAVYLGLHRHTFFGAAAAFLLGYAADSILGAPAVGLHAFALTFVFLLVYLLSRRLWMDNAFGNVMVVFGASLLKTFAVAALLLYVGAEPTWTGLVAKLWTEALAGALFTIPVFALLDQGRRRWEHALR